MNITAASTLPQRPFTFSSKETSNDDVTLSAIELRLFSYNIDEENFQQVIEAVAGNHFIVTKIEEKHNEFSTFRIAPQDYCLIEGGMMYTSAGSIISELISRGFLIKGYNALAA